MAASLGQKLIWKDTGEPVKLEGKFNVTRLGERPVEAHHVNAAEFNQLMTGRV